MNPSFYRPRCLCRVRAVMAALVLAPIASITVFANAQQAAQSAPPAASTEAPPVAGGSTTPIVAPPYYAPEDPQELLRVDDTMRTFFTQRTSKRSADRDRLRDIVNAILLPGGLGFSYEVQGTYDARETFRRRRGNCVSFALLFVAVARELGFTASFQNIESTTHWNKFGQIVASVQHVNVRVDTFEGSFVVDLRPDMVPQGAADTLRVVPDARAFAHFYNTLGFFRLVNGNPGEAMRYMTLATATDPTCAAAWSNRGSMHARFGELTASRACFERSLRIDPRGLVTLDGFVLVLRRIGTPDDLRTADKLDRRAKSLRDRNPYYQQYVAELALERGDWQTAEKSLRRAITLKDDDPEFYGQWIAALQRLGRADEARRATEKLAKLTKRLASASARIVP